MVLASLILPVLCFFTITTSCYFGSTKLTQLEVLVMGQESGTNRKCLIKEVTVKQKILQNNASLQHF